MSEPRRLVEVQLQRYAPQLITITVSIPEDWTDDKVKSELGAIYGQVDPADHNWRDDMFDCAYREGVHELTGEPGLDARSDLVFPAEVADAK